MDSKKPLYKSIPFWVLVLLTLYSALGFFAVPYFIEKKLTEIAKNELNSTFLVEKVSFNPYTISTDFTKIQLIDKDSTQWFSADALHTNLHLWFTLFNHTSLEKIQLVNPQYLLLTENNAKTIKYPVLETKSSSSESSELMLDIDSIDIQKGRIEYHDESGAKQFSLGISEIQFHHQTFTTQDKESAFSLSFKTDNQDETLLTGLFNFAQLSLSLDWQLKHWSTATLFNLLGDSDNKIQGFSNQTGLIEARGNLIYSSVNSDNNTLPSLFVESLQLSDFSNRAQNSEQIKINIPKLQLNQATIDLNQEQIHIDSVQAPQTEIKITFDENYNLIFTKTEGDSTSIPANQDSQSWAFNVREITANNSAVQLTKLSQGNSASNTLLMTHLQMNNLSNSANEKSQLNLQIKTSNQAHIKATSEFSLSQASAKNTLDISKLNLKAWQSWFPEELNLFIDSGLLSLHQKIDLNADSFKSNGQLDLNNIKLLDANKELFAQVNTLAINQIDVDSKSKQILLDSIVMDQAQGRLIVSEEKQLNISSITDEQAPDSQTKDSSDWKIAIKKVEFIDGQTELTDKSIKPHYHTELSKINGSITGLSSTNLSKADVKLKGLLDSYGQVEITGKINPLSEKAYTDIQITVENISLENFSSYSAQFLGFPILTGKVDFDLSYQLNQSMLKGLNNLRFKQLKFGDKTASKDAVNLPLKLAVGLLTDGKGLMKINLPVSGNIDDPEFSYGGIVFKAFFKLITGIVTSPFKLLGKLVPGGAELDLSGIDFAAGKTELMLGEDKKLKAMKNIMQQRPSILLELTAVIHSDNDKKALQQQQLEEQLAIGSAFDLSQSETQKKLEKLFKKSFSAEKWQLLEKDSTTEDGLNLPLLYEKSWQKLLNNQNVDEELNDLAKNRAQYIQKQLIETYQIASQRIYIKSKLISDELRPQVKFSIGNL